MRTLRHRGLAAGALASALVSVPAAGPATAQEGPIGPCSPYHAADGAIPSEMPGCGRRLRPAEGSLRDELEFRRARPGGEDAAPGDDDEPPPPRRGRHPRRG